jgi:hypothetical protein
MVKFVARLELCRGFVAILGVAAYFGLTSRR